LPAAPYREPSLSCSKTSGSAFTLEAGPLSRPDVESPAAYLRSPHRNPVSAIAGRDRMHPCPSDVLRGAPSVSGHLFGTALDDDTPANAGLEVPAVDFKGDMSTRGKRELCTGGGAKHHDPAFNRVIHRKDFWPTAHVESNPAQVARTKQEETLVF